MKSISLFARTLSAIALAACAMAVSAQSPLHEGRQASFEVATIKPNNPKALFYISPLGSTQIVHMAGSARSLMIQAYGITSDSKSRAVGGVDPWIDKNIYRIEAKIPDETFAQMQKMSSKEQKEQVMAMLQALLASRFKLQSHWGTRELPVYELTVDSKGSKLPAPNPPPISGASGWSMSPTGEMRVRNMKLDELLQNPIFGLDGRTVIDHTGLDGTYNLKLQWKAANRPTAGASPFGVANEGSSGLDEGPSVFDLVKDQLGLKLSPSKAQLTVIYIDHIEQPTEN